MVSLFSLLKMQLWLPHNGFCRACTLVVIMAFIIQFVPDVTRLYVCLRMSKGRMRGNIQVFRNVSVFHGGILRRYRRETSFNCVNF